MNCRSWPPCNFPETFLSPKLVLCGLMEFISTHSVFSVVVCCRCQPDCMQGGGPYSWRHVQKSVWVLEPVAKIYLQSCLITCQHFHWAPNTAEFHSALRAWPGQSGLQGSGLRDEQGMQHSGFLFYPEVTGLGFLSPLG